jgi:hypothetical protein
VSADNNLEKKEKALGGKYHRQTIIYINPKPFLMRKFQNSILPPPLQKSDKSRKNW